MSCGNLKLSLYGAHTLFGYNLSFVSEGINMTSAVFSVDDGVVKNDGFVACCGCGLWHTRL